MKFSGFVWKPSNISITDGTASSSLLVGTVIIALMQKNAREMKASANQSVRYQMIGYDIYCVNDEKTTMDAKYYKANWPAQVKLGGNIREVVGIFKLTPGNYCVVPYTFDANTQCDFLLRIYSERPLG